MDGAIKNKKMDYDFNTAVDSLVNEHENEIVETRTTATVPVETTSKILKFYYENKTAILIALGVLVLYFVLKPKK